MDVRNKKWQRKWMAIDSSSLLHRIDLKCKISWILWNHLCGIYVLLTRPEVKTYILSPKRECRTGRILARSINRTDRAQQDPSAKRPRADIFLRLVDKKFITRLKKLQKNAITITDWKDTENFKCAILIESRLSLYSHLTFQKKENEKRVGRREKECIMCEFVLSVRKVNHKTAGKS